MWSLSPGPHNVLEKAVVEVLAPALLVRPQVVYLGDTERRIGYQNRALMRRLNLPLEISEPLPDVIVCDHPEHTLLVVEAVVSSGAISAARLAQLKELTSGPAGLRIPVLYVSAFPTRRVLRRFIEELSWGSSAWVAEEPRNIIYLADVPDR